MGKTNFSSLPGDCISTILSLTAPKDACCCSLVSSAMSSEAKCNITWEKFLPQDYQKIVSASVSPVPFFTKKELYFRLCDSILIDGGNKRFSLEKSTGKKCYMLSAKELSITSADDQTHWCWKPTPNSRFSEVAELKTISWLEIHGNINASLLSSKTTYAAYLLIKHADGAYGLHSVPSQISVKVGDHESMGTAYLHGTDSRKQILENLYFLNRMQVMRAKVIEGDDRVPCDREDGWMEIELGKFFIDSGNEGEVKMSLMEIKSDYLKGGLVIEGIEVRPKV